MSRYFSDSLRCLIIVIRLDVLTPAGLADHAETLSDYLYEYGEYPDKRAAHSHIFFTYLLSACWQKLHRRFCSWRGLGLIRNFEERIDLLNGHLELIGTSGGPDQNFLSRGPGDRTLVHFLHKNKDVFVKMLPSVLDNIPAFDKLRQEVNNAYENDNLKKLYTKETALGFHYLVYGSFILAGKAIRLIKDHHEPIKLAGAEKKQDYDSKVEIFKKAIAAAVLPLKLLHCVLSSTVFKSHIGVWTNDGESIQEILPTWSQKKDNLVFGIRRGILGRSKKGPSEESPTEGGDEDGNTPKESLTKDDGDDDEVPEVRKSVC